MITITRKNNATSSNKPLKYQPEDVDQIEFTPLSQQEQEQQEQISMTNDQ